MAIYRHIVIILLCATLAVIAFMLIKTAIAAIKEKYQNRYYYEEVQLFGVDNEGHYLLKDASGSLWLFDGSGKNVEPGTYIIKIDMEADDENGVVESIYKKVNEFNED